MENLLIEEIKNKDCIISDSEIEYNNKKLFLEIKFNKIIKNPSISKKIVELIKNKINNIKFDYILSYNMNCIPIASVLASLLDKSMIFINPEDNSIYEDFEENETVLVIKDIIYSKIDLINNINTITEKNIPICHFLSVFDYEIFEENPFTKLNNDNINLKTDYDNLLPISSFISIPILNKIDDSLEKDEFMEKVNGIIEKKKTSIFYRSYNFTKSGLINEMQRFGNYILGFYFQVEGIEDFDINFLQRIKVLSVKLNFLLIVDKKFNDQYESVFHQYNNSLYRYSEWVDAVSVTLNKNAIKALNDSNAKLLLLQANNESQNLSYDDSNVIFSLVENKKKWLNILNFNLIEDDLIEDFLLEKIKNDYNILLLDAYKMNTLLPSQLEDMIIKLREIFWKCQIKIELEHLSSSK